MAASTPDMSRAVWRKSSHSANAGNCVEVAGNLVGVVAVRDSKDQHGPALIVRSQAWRHFAAQVKTGHLGLA